MIVNKVQQFVDELGINRSQFYKRTGISKTTAYALYENPFRIPDTDTLDRICSEFNCNPGDLLEYVRTEE
jgi:DNA-binding Xre family transcriptional regulator